jgi:hypothetical protein
MGEFEKVAEVIHEYIVVEVFEKGAAPKNYFDIECKYEFASKVGGRNLSGYIPVKHVPSLIIAIVRTMEYISQLHRSTRTSDDSHAAPSTKNVVRTWEPYEAPSTGAESKQVKEVKCGVAVTSLLEDSNGFPYVQCQREYNSGGTWKRSSQLQQRNLRDLLISIAEVWDYHQKRG